MIVQVVFCFLSSFSCFCTYPFFLGAIPSEGKSVPQEVAMFKAVDKIYWKRC